jgi:hypothetical protein
MIGLPARGIYKIKSICHKGTEDIFTIFFLILVYSWLNERSLHKTDNN